MVSQQYQLVMRTGPAAGKAYELGKSEIAIGRDPSNDIIINEAEVSRKHARLLWQDEAYVLEDLGSTNGSFVNGQHLLSPQKLQPGDTILLGENVSFIYEQLQPDADSTVAVRPKPVEAGPAPIPQYRAPQQAMPATPAPQAQPAYSEHIPPGPVMAGVPEMPLQPEKPSARRSWLYAGCGCVVVFILIFLIAFVAFDQLNLWCIPPFDQWFGSILGYTCP